MRVLDQALNKAMGTLREGDFLVMAAIDKFNNPNDTHGHDTGDEVLKLVAALLDDTGERAKAYPYGGEEVPLLFEGCDSKKVLEALKRADKQFYKAKKAGRNKVCSDLR